MQDARVPKPMLSAEQAMLQMLAQRVTVGLNQALDRVLAQPLLSGY